MAPLISGVASSASEVLAFWFADATASPDRAGERMSFWFGVDGAVDRQIRERFGALHESAAAGGLASWEGAARSALALVIVLDQFSRNVHRGDARAFAQDAIGLAVARRALARGFERSLAPIEHAFLLLPLEHAEDLIAQRECVARSRALAESAPPQWREALRGFVPYAEHHLALIERFGRFPHRNRALGRRSTAEEDAYLAEGGATYGQGS